MLTVKLQLRKDYLRVRDRQHNSFIHNIATTIITTSNNNNTNNNNDKKRRINRKSIL